MTFDETLGFNEEELFRPVLKSVPDEKFYWICLAMVVSGALALFGCYHLGKYAGRKESLPPIDAPKDQPVLSSSNENTKSFSPPADAL